MIGSKYIAIDLGAESGRIILGTLQDRKLLFEEIYRFPNIQEVKKGHTYWNTVSLFKEIKNGLSLVVKNGNKDICSISVDTWGVDFGLLDNNDNLLEEPYSYRDSRTDSMIERSFELISKDDMYSLTGNQFLQINTVFQLLSMVESKSDMLKKCKTLLLMPDLFNFLLTGTKQSEYTIASTTQLLNASKRQWEPLLFDKLGIPLNIMTPLVQPGSKIGQLLPDISEETGLRRIDVIASASHDTANAVAAIPFNNNASAFLSSGSWSLLGVELNEPLINQYSLDNNFTNEGGYNNSILFLRITIGLWILQQCLKSWNKQGKSFHYSDFVNMAEKAPEFSCIINPDDNRFLNPPDMPEAIISYCNETKQKSPDTIAGFVRTILESIALKYKFIIEKMHTMLDANITSLHIVGGGSQNKLLNQFSANAVGVSVIAGPVEATAAGNIMIQAITQGDISGIDEGRDMVRESFMLKHYEPQKVEKWELYYQSIKYLLS